MKLVALASLMIAWSLTAANLDGRWAAEVTPRGKNAAAAKPVDATLDLKSQGSQLTGSLIVSKGKHAQPVAIQDGRIDGDRFTFATVQRTKKGDVRFIWRGKLNGEQLSGTRSRDGAKRGAHFTARRQA